MDISVTILASLSLSHSLHWYFFGFCQPLPPVRNDWISVDERNSLNILKSANKSFEFIS